jgi:hypothetical protein
MRARSLYTDSAVIGGVKVTAETAPAGIYDGVSGELKPGRHADPPNSEEVSMHCGRRQQLHSFKY